MLLNGIGAFLFAFDGSRIFGMKILLQMENDESATACEYHDDGVAGRILLNCGKQTFSLKILEWWILFWLFSAYSFGFRRIFVGLANRQVAALER